MDLHDSAFLAILNVKKVHTEIELKDYMRVIKHYDPDVPAFEQILSKIDELTSNIRNYEEAIKEL